MQALSSLDSHLYEGEPTPLQWTLRVLTTGPPRRSYLLVVSASSEGGNSISEPPVPMEGSGSITRTAVIRAAERSGARRGRVWQGSSEPWVTGSSPQLGNLTRRAWLGPSSVVFGVKMQEFAKQLMALLDARSPQENSTVLDSKGIVDTRDSRLPKASLDHEDPGPG